MAMLPCFVGPHRHPGRNVNVYASYGTGLQFRRLSFRLCPAHWDTVEEDLAKFEVNPSNPALGSLDSKSECVTCGEPVLELARQVFVTSYPTKDERKDYWAKLHDDCTLRGILAAADAQTGRDTFA